MLGHIVREEIFPRVGAFLGATFTLTLPDSQFVAQEFVLFVRDALGGQMGTVDTE
jgi:hypothetical protein